MKERLVVPRPRVPYAGRKFSQFSIGDCFGDDVVVKDHHLADGARLIGDYNPLHVDVDFAERSLFGGTIRHGVITSALMSAPFGNLVAGTAIGYLEHDAHFLAPVRSGDTLRTTWTVTELSPKPARGGGIVSAECEARNQHGEVALAATATLLVTDRAG